MAAVTALPRRLGKYHVLDRLAQGGMAEIYKAKTVGIAGFEKILALKRILPNFARESRFIRSFIDEARIAVTLNHRNIVQVFDFGKADGELYLAMELIEGVDLRTALAASAQAGVQMPPAVACCILADLAAGLDYAHRKADAEGRPLGIVHCDVSPQNIMLSFEGFVKILDFGVSRARFSNPPKEKRLRGKPRYMAPEQTRGLQPTAATDVFATGILCWELLTGLPLFEGSDLQEILAAVRRADAPAVSSLNPEVPQHLSEAIARALNADPSMRGDAGELAFALARTARDLTPLPSSRAIGDWLAAVMQLPDVASPFTAPPRSTGALTAQLRVPALGTGNETAIEAVFSSATGVDEVPAAMPVPPSGVTANTTIITEVVDSGDEPLSDPQGTSPGRLSSALVENRRVVATAVVCDGGEPGTRRELTRMTAELAYKHGALVHSQAADGLVAVFGLEVAGEDDIASAMQFSLGAVELARATAQADRAGGPALRVATRAGITAQRSGQAVRLRGDAVEEARALARDADPGRPLLTGGTGRLASAQFVFRELPSRRHRSRRLRVLELVGPRDFDERTRALRERRGRFVGRTADLDQMSGALDRAAAGGRRGVVAVVGGAGMGKSRLVAEFVARVEGMPHPPRVVALAASPVAKGAPFWLIGDLLQSALDLPPRRGEAARGATSRRLRHVLEQAGLERGELDECVSAAELALELRDGALASSGQASTVDLRDRVANALRSVWRSLGGSIVTVIEDLHLADVPSAEAMRAALRASDEPGGGGELVVVTSREVAGMPPDAEFVHLEELAEPDRSDLIADRLADGASAESVAAVARRAGGNPLFIEELASAVRDLGRAEVPSSLRDVLIARVDRLTPATKATLQHAAVVGPVFRSRLLEELLGPQVHQHLQELVDEGLVVRADYGAAEVDEGELAFRHVLLQEVVYDSLAVAARRQTHARLGRMLAARVEAGREEPPLIIARHLELGGEPALAAAQWQRAGQIALAAYDAMEARHAFTRVLELIGDRNDAEARTRRRAALFGREHANREIGDHDAQARDLADLEVAAAGDPLLMADVANRKATRLLRMGDYAGAMSAAEAAEKAARASGDEHTRGEALRLLGEAYERTGEYESGLAVVTEAVEIFRKLGSQHDEMRARIGVGRNYLARSRYESAWATYEPILERLDENADPWLERVVRNHVAIIHLCLGEFEAAMWSARRAMELCEFFGDKARTGDNLAICGGILLAVGQYPEALDAMNQALAMHDETKSRWNTADCQVYAGAALCSLQNYGAGLAMLENCLATAREIGALYIEANGELARAAAFLRRCDEGDDEHALDAADRALVASRGATLHSAEIVALARQGEALRRTGRLPEARAATEEAVRLLEIQRYLEGSSEEEVYYMHYRVAAELGEPWAVSYLDRARAGLKRKLDMLTNPDWRSSFAEAIPMHRAILDGT